MHMLRLLRQFSDEALGPNSKVPCSSRIRLRGKASTNYHKQITNMDHAL